MIFPQSQWHHSLWSLKYRALPRWRVQNLFFKNRGGKSLTFSAAFVFLEGGPKKFQLVVLLRWPDVSGGLPLYISGQRVCPSSVFSTFTCSKEGHRYGHKIGFNSCQGILEIFHFACCILTSWSIRRSCYCMPPSEICSNEICPVNFTFIFAT